MNSQPTPDIPQEEDSEPGGARHDKALQSSKVYTRSFHLLLNMKEYFEKRLYKEIGYGAYNVFSIIGQNDKERSRFSTILEKMGEVKCFDPILLGLSQKESRAVACFLGLAICDALGASTEFTPYKKDRRDLVKSDFEDVKKQIAKGALDSRSGKIGIWTDDCSMALCMADSLLLQGFKFDPVHTRYMFHMWLEHGLGNGGRPHSIGLGGNISISMSEFTKQQVGYAIEGNRFNNGNGSLMRLAPVPICFSANLAQAMEFSGLQSKTTHNGDEAKECARLLAAIICNLIHRQKEENWREVIQETCHNFETDVKSVKCLALSQQESEELYNQQKELFSTFAKFNKSVKDRNWNWKHEDHTYSQCRFKQMPGYIGSYCMDALAMALHTVWHNDCFHSIAIMNANIGGDSDTVGAIAGQIAGAIYGIDSDMLKLYSQMEDCKSKRFDVFLKAFKLFNHIPVDFPADVPQGK